MKKRTKETQITIYEDRSELPVSIQALCDAAQAALANSYSKYSKFKVGASALLDDGTIVKGANQENAVYPLGLCAERVVIFSVGGQQPERAIQAMAVTTEKQIPKGEVPAFPCGSCRQALIEVENRYGHPIPIYIFSGDGEIYSMESAHDLLPFAFDERFL